MRTLVAVLAMLWCWCGLAQMPPRVMQDMQEAYASKPAAPAGGGQSPETISGLAYRWKHTTLDTNVAVSSWVDSISGIILTNETVATRPTNTALGVQFSNAHMLSNSLPFFVTNFALWLSIKPTSANAYGAIIADEEGVTASVIYQGAAVPVTVQVGGRDLTPAGAPLASGQRYDVLLSVSNLFAHVFTNGVLARTRDISEAQTYYLMYKMGQWSIAGYWEGYISEYCVWTNNFGIGTNALGLHNYSTAIYQ